MKLTRLQTIEDVVTAVSSWYARRSWWLEEADLAQEAWTVALEVLPKAMPESKFRGYVWATVSKHLSRYCWRFSSPASTSKPGRKKLEGVMRCEMPDGLVSLELDPEAQLYEAQAAELVIRLQWELRHRVIDLYYCEPWTTVEGGWKPSCNEATGVVAILVDGFEPRFVAPAVGVRKESLTYIAQHMKKRVKQDQDAVSLLYQIREHRGASL